MTTTTNDTAHLLLAAKLTEEVQQRIRCNRTKKQTFIIADFEYLYDHIAHQKYVGIDGEQAEQCVRWPFHRIVCASWLTLTFEGYGQPPVVSSLTTLGKHPGEEEDIVRAFCSALGTLPAAILITWGGEVKDIAIIRRAAAQYGILMPPQLVDGNPHTPTRIDLCSAVSNKSNKVHIGEYATAQGLPVKMVMPSKAVGQAAVDGKSSLVRQQCECDVVTTALVLGRYLVSHGRVTTLAHATDRVIADAIIKTHQHRKFVREDLTQWRGKLDKYRDQFSAPQ